MTDRIDGYAAAVLAFAQAEGELQTVEREFSAVARAIETSGELRDALSDPLVPEERKQSMIEALLEGKASSTTINLVSLVVAQGHGSDIPAVADRLAGQAAATRQREVAEVRSAVPLDEATVERLAEALGRATGKQVEVRLVVDPSVVGGIVARVGDTVIDGSIRRRLDSLRTTVHSR